MSFCDLVYAGAENKADVTLYIHGEKSNGGPIFNTSGQMGGGLWAPGVSASGTMRIYNNYCSRISIHNLGIKMKLYDTINKREVTDAGLIREFAEAMKLTIKKGKRLVFNNTIYNKSFYEMLYVRGSSSQKGFDLGILNWVNIGKDSSVDFEYTVHMDEGAGNNLQGLKATVDFIINAQEKPVEGPPYGDDSDKNKGENSNLVQEPVEVIPDIGGHWAHDCIIALIEHDVLDPDENSSIRPEDYITRAEAAVLIGRALKLEESKDISTGYVDNIPTWARGYVISTTKAKVFKGYPGRVFKSYRNISREEMTAVLIRAFRKDSTSQKEITFTDRGTIAKWARDSIAKSVEEGIVTGYSDDNTFRPKAYMTRAEAFTLVCKLLKYHEEHKIEVVVH
ncbi:MAG TPA: S-layer homology domain-containing protein [Candidatus Nitrosocosmicus sp.]|nr:S-layer homology domain-containing protein [Candidatus Nitrosocosmicus sp.]